MGLRSGPRTGDTPAEAADEADRLGQVILGLGAVLRVVLVPEIAGDQREIGGRSARRRAGVRVRGASETGPSRLCRFWAAVIRPMAIGPKLCRRRAACGSASHRLRCDVRRRACLGWMMRTSSRPEAGRVEQQRDCTSGGSRARCQPKQEAQRRPSRPRVAASAIVRRLGGVITGRSAPKNHGTRLRMRDNVGGLHNGSRDQRVHSCRHKKWARAA